MLLDQTAKDRRYYARQLANMICVELRSTTVSHRPLAEVTRETRPRPYLTGKTFAVEIAEILADGNHGAELPATYRPLCREIVPSALAIPIVHWPQILTSGPLVCARFRCPKPRPA